jgi:hypothetical protein
MVLCVGAERATPWSELAVLPEDDDLLSKILVSTSSRAGTGSEEGLTKEQEAAARRAFLP